MDKTKNIFHVTTILFLMFLSILLVPVCHAKVIIEGWQITGQEFDVEGETFTLSYYKQNNKLSFSGTSTTLIVEQGDCEERDMRLYCFEDVSFDSDVSEIKDGVEYPGVYIMIEEKGPSLIVTREFSDSNIPLGSESEVTVKINNQGDLPARNVVYEETYPDNIKVIPKKMSLDGNRVFWEGLVKQGEEITLKFGIKPLDITEYDSIGKYSYLSGINTLTGETEKETIETRLPFDISYNISSLVPAKLEVVSVIVTISNLDESEGLDVSSLEFRFPSGLVYQSSSRLMKQVGNTFTYSGSIAPDSEQDFEIQLYSDNQGKFDFSISSIININKEKIEEKKDYQLAVDLSALVPEIGLSSKTLKAGEDLTITLDIENQGKDDAIGINGKISSDLFDTTEFNSKLIRPSASEQFFKKTITLKDVEDRTSYSIGVKGNYANEDQHVYDFDTESIVTVLPREKHFSIEHKYKKITADDKSFLEVEIYIKNNEPYEFTGVDIFDIIPKELKKDSGEFISNIDLAANEEKKAYSYSLLIPVDIDVSMVTLKTFVNSKGSDGELYKFSKETQVNIINLGVTDRTSDDFDLASDDEDSTSDASDTDSDKIVDINASTDNKQASVDDSQEKVSFFKKIYNFLFGWLG